MVFLLKSGECQVPAARPLVFAGVTTNQSHVPLRRTFTTSWCPFWAARCKAVGVPEADAPATTGWGRELRSSCSTRSWRSNLPFLTETHIVPENWPGPKRKLVYIPTNHPHFQGLCQFYREGNLEENGKIDDIGIGDILLMEEIRRSPPGMYKTLVNNGRNYQPQLVSRISEPSTVGAIF